VQNRVLHTDVISQERLDNSSSFVYTSDVVISPQKKELSDGKQNKEDEGFHRHRRRKQATLRDHHQRWWSSGFRSRLHCEGVAGERKKALGQVTHRELR